jgi:hypothetical protein
MNYHAPQSFQQVLAEVLKHIADHGYSDQDRMEEYLLRLRMAAEREIGSPQAADKAMRDALGAIYGRLIDQGGVSKYAPEVPRYTIAMVRPQLRAELDRRVMAATDLIKLRRGEAIDKTLRQVVGWTTSIPPGGVSDESLREVKKRVGDSLKQYRFECRRVSIDQGHKLVNNVANIVAVDNGAIAGEWHSHWRQAGYNYRKDHKERDGKFFAVKDSWAVREGLIKKGDGYLEDITQPGQEPFCRCFVRYVSSPRRLPDDMLTDKGRQWIAQGRARQGMAA